MSVRILTGDCRETLKTLADESVHCCVTSPPYWGLRDYGHDDQIGLEPTPDEYVAQLVAVFREVRRVLRDDGVLFLNLGDSYFGGGYANHAINGERWLDEHGGDRRASRQQDRIRANPGLKPKDLVGIPWRVAFALQADGWWLRSDIIWAKRNPMPESVTDRPTSAHEHVFLLAKSRRYFYDGDAIKERSVSDHDSRNGYARPEQVSRGGRGQTAGWTREASGGTRNRRNVWTLANAPFPDAHFAVMPPALAERCILAGCPEGGTVLDPFGGAGTTGLVADKRDRDAIICEINEEYAGLAENRIAGDCPIFAEVQRS